MQFDRFWNEKPHREKHARVRPGVQALLLPQPDGKPAVAAHAGHP